MLRPHATGVDDDTLLEAFARHESDIEAGPYQRYAEVLAGCLRALGVELGFETTAAEMTKAIWSGPCPS